MSIITKSLQNGTIYRKLGEICDIKRGDRITKAQVLPIGKGLYPVISGGITPMGYLDNFNRPQNTITIAQYGSAGFVNWQTEKFWANDICYSLFPHETLLNKKFLYYILCNNQDLLYKMVNRDAIPYHLPQINIAKLNIPTPPLEVQNEIVRILDTFTSHTAELQAELQARKEQYEYYRNKLLSFDRNDENVKWMRLGEIGTFTRGNGLQKKDFTEKGYPCIHYGQIHTHYGTFADSTISYTSYALAKKLRKASYGDLIIATTSEDVEGVCKACAWLGHEDVAISGDAYIYKHNQSPQYIAYLFQTKLFYEYKKKAITGTKVVRVSGDSMKNFQFPIPPLSEQQRIVSILDKFETLVNDLTEGIPAEIAAVQEQYEYYRNKLLSFPKLEA